MTPANHQFNLTESIGIDKAAEGGHRAIDADNSPLGEAAAKGEPIAMPDLDAMPDHPLRDVAMEAGFHSVLVVPLVDQTGMLGSLVVLRQNAGEFSANLIGLMKTFAHQSVLAMRNARLFTEVDHKSRELRDRERHRAASRPTSCRSRPTSSRTGTSRWRSASRPSSARSSASASSSASWRRRWRN